MVSLLYVLKMILKQGFGEDGSGVVQTAWALLSLMAADYHDTSVIDRGIKYLMHKQVTYIY